MKTVIKKIMWKCDSALLYFSAILLLIATLLAVINAIMRSVGLNGFPWSDEVCVIFMIFMVFLTQPLLEGEDINLCIGILDNILKNPILRKIMQVFKGVVIIFVMGFLLTYCWQIIEKAAKLNYVTSVVKLPRYILYLCIFVAFILVIINWIINIFFKKPGEKYVGSDLLSEEYIEAMEAKAAEEAKLVAETGKEDKHE